MKITKKAILGQLKSLARETGLSFELEDASIEGEHRARYNVHLVENGHRVKQLNYPYQFNHSELYVALRFARDVCFEEVKE